MVKLNTYGLWKCLSYFHTIQIGKTLVFARDISFHPGSGKHQQYAVSGVFLLHVFLCFYSIKNLYIDIHRYRVKYRRNILKKKYNKFWRKVREIREEMKAEIIGETITET